MTIQTYDQLLSECASWLNRSDLSNKIPIFVDLLEAELDRRLRTTDQLKRATTSVADQFASLPSDFLELRNIQLDVTPEKLLQYLTPDRADELRRTEYRTSGEPVYYTILGRNIEFLPTPQTSYTMQISYYSRIDKLDSTTQTTNVFLEKSPDLYLYGTLRHAESYLMNDERLPVWTRWFEVALSQLVEQEEGKKTGEGMLVMRPKTRIDTGAWK